MTKTFRKGRLLLCACLVGLLLPATTAAADKEKPAPPADKPLPAPPLKYVDTTWAPPTGGTTWPAHDAAGFSKALDNCEPGDVIVLDAGKTYSGNFILPQKVNPGKKWIYIESSALASLPPPGTRVSPADAANMPAITTPNTTAAITLAPGANHWRLAGLEIRSDSEQGGDPAANPPKNNWSYYAIQTTRQNADDALVDSVTEDRCYVHGSDTQDIMHAVDLDGSNMAIVDSYVSDIHAQGYDAQGVITTFSPGPYKIVNNFISASTENIMFSPADGWGQSKNPYLASDIEIRRNHLYKPLAWDKCGIHGTIPAGGKKPDGSTCPAGVSNQWVVKNNLEFKIGQRAIVTGNILENNWVSGQVGYAFVLTARVQSAPNLWISDILFQNNILKNVDRGINTLEQSDQEGFTWFGYNKRVLVDNNLILLSTNHDNDGGHFGVKVDGGDYLKGHGDTYGLTDYVFQHNTITTIDGSPVDQSFYFTLPSNVTCTTVQTSPTHNVWILDNAMTRQPSGDCGWTTVYGGAALTGVPVSGGWFPGYMRDPPPIDPRFYGNLMFVAKTDKLFENWRNSNNTTTKPFFYVDTSVGNYQLSKPNWTKTTDGKVAGIDWDALQAALAGAASPPESKPVVESPK